MTKSKYWHKLHIVDWYYKKLLEEKRSNEFWKFIFVRRNNMILEDLIDVMWGEEVEVELDYYNEEKESEYIKCKIQDERLNPYYDSAVTSISWQKDHILIVLEIWE